MKTVLCLFLSVIILGVLNYCIRKQTSKNSKHPLEKDLKEVKVNGNAICYVEKGNGIPIVMVHGSQMNCYDFRDNIDYFAEKYRVYAIDMIGCGWSAKPNGKYSPDYFAEFLKDFMEALSIEKAVFMASSWGGGHSLHFSLKYPERVSALILSSPCGYKHKPSAMDFLRVPLIGNLILLYMNKSMVKSQLKSAYYDKGKVSQVLIDSVYAPFFHRGFHRSVLNSYRNAHFDYVENNLDNIKIPTQLIWGQEDHFHPVDMAMRMNKQIKNSQLIIYQDCGHLPHSEKSQLFNQDASSFLDCQTQVHTAEKKL